jgi:hypothetical protein
MEILESIQEGSQITTLARTQTLDKCAYFVEIYDLDTTVSNIVFETPFFNKNKCI